MFIAWLKKKKKKKKSRAIKKQDAYQKERPMVLRFSLSYTPTPYPEGFQSRETTFTLRVFLPGKKGLSRYLRPPKPVGYLVV